MASTKAKYLESVRSAARVVVDRARLEGWDSRSLEEGVSFLDSKVRIFRKLGKKEAQSRASKRERYPTSLKTYWEALEAFYTSKFEKRDGRIAWPDDALRNLLVAMLFVHRSPLRAQNVLSLKLHDTVRLGKRGYEVKLGHSFKTSGSSIHGDTHWTRHPSG